MRSFLPEASADEMMQTIEDINREKRMNPFIRTTFGFEMVQATIRIPGVTALTKRNYRAGSKGGDRDRKELGFLLKMILDVETALMIVTVMMIVREKTISVDTGICAIIQTMQSPCSSWSS